MKNLLFFLFFPFTCFADFINIKTIPEFVINPKSSRQIPNNYFSINHIKFRKNLIGNDNLTFSEIHVLVNTQNKDADWKFVLFDPTSKKNIDLSDRFTIEFLSSSSAGILNNLTSKEVGFTYLLGDINETKFCKIVAILNKSKIESYGSLNLRYRVIRNDTGDHWYPYSSFVLKSSGIFSDSLDNTTCNSHINFIPPKIQLNILHWTWINSFWSPVNRTLILSNP